MPWRYRILFAGLLALSLGAKVYAGVRTPYDLQMQAAQKAREAAIAFFQRQGFAVSAGQLDPELPFLEADRAGCRLHVVFVAPQGWHRDVIARMATPEEQFFFSYNGEIWPEQPVWQGWRDHLLWVAAEFSGLSRSIHPVLGVIASPVCGARALPWHELALVR